jgi:hypothetical protein
MALSIPGRMVLLLAALALLALGWMAIVNVPMGLRGSNHTLPPQVSLPNQGSHPALQAPAQPIQDPSDNGAGTGAGSVRNTTPAKPAAPAPTHAAVQTAPPAALPADQGSERCGGIMPPGESKHPPIACSAT